MLPYLSIKNEHEKISILVKKIQICAFVFVSRLYGAIRQLCR